MLSNYVSIQVQELSLASLSNVLSFLEKKMKIVTRSWILEGSH